MISIFMVLISKTTQTEKVIKMNIYVSERNVYGRATIYPQCDKAKAFANIAGTKTLTFETIAEIKNLGYDVLIKQKDKL